MLKAIFSKVAWVGRTASTVFGLALVLALLFGVATTAFGDNGDFFKLGKSNTASKVSKLIKEGAGPALDLQVDSGAPLKVNSDGLVKDLNADEVDGQSFSCPSNTLFHEGACIETTKRSSAGYWTASPDCLDEGRRLPTVAELQTFRNVSGSGVSGYELTSQLDIDSTDYEFIVDSTGNAARTPVGAIWPYRCVASPS